MTESLPKYPVQTMSWEEFQAYCSPFDNRLPENASHDLFELQFAEMQSRFRRLASAIGIEGEDWELPPHYQNAVVFYAYLNESKMYSPQLMDTISHTMAGFDDVWIAQLECFDPPLKPGGISFLAYHKGLLLTSNDQESLALVAELTGESRRTMR